MAGKEPGLVPTRYELIKFEMSKVTLLLVPLPYIVTDEGAIELLAGVKNSIIELATGVKLKETVPVNPAGLDTVVGHEAPRVTDIFSF